ncbi:MAG: LysR family transcriptional regulator [Myxococcota bacterium]
MDVRNAQAIDSDVLQHFLLVLEHGTFTAAAKAAHLSQPAFSASIAKLESDLGARLFERGRQGARILPTGEALVPHARAVLAALVDGRRAVEDVAELRSGRLSLAAGATACSVLLPKVLADFRRDHPAVHVRLLESTTTEALEALDAGAVDLAIVGRAHGAPVQDLDPSDVVLRESMHLVAAPAFLRRWESKHGPIRERDYRGAVPFLSFRAGSSTRTVLNEAFPTAQIVMELGSISAIVSHVRAGVGVALLSEWAVAADVKRKRLVKLRTRRRFRRELRLCHRGVQRLSAAAAQLRLRLLDGTPA